MKKILEFSKFVPDYRPLTLNLKGQSIVFTKEEAEKKEKLIRSLLKTIYRGFYGNEQINFDGAIISGELLNKAQKNIAILYDIIDISKQLGKPIKTANDIIDFIDLYGQDLFHPDGEFFNKIYSRLGGTTEKGRFAETKSNEFFIRYAASKGVTVELLPPADFREDIGGIDAYFIHNGNKYTIQTKTLSSISEGDDFYSVYIKGDFTPIKTHYLVLIPSNADIENLKYIFKGKNVVSLKDERGLDYYQIPKADLLHSEFTS